VPYVITEPCVGVKDKSCVAVCPVDCIQGKDDDNQLYIDPSECIDCGLCEPECPAEAILPDTESGLEKWLELSVLSLFNYCLILFFKVSTCDLAISRPILAIVNTPFSSIFFSTFLALVNA